jgi:glycosyltransferase involved in cell wall biosynthesis
VPFFKRLSQKINYSIVFGGKYFTPSVVTSDDAFKLDKSVFSKNFYFLNRTFLIQYWSGFLKDILSPNMRVVELNPRCLVSWLSLISSFVFRRGKTILWGHLYNREGVFGRFSLRRIMTKMSNGIVFYTKGQASEYIEIENGYLSSKVVGYAPNSIISAEDITSFDSSGKDFLYVGRVTKAKKVDVLVRAFSIFSTATNINNVLHIVGSGETLQEVKDLTLSLGISNKVIFHGHIGDHVYLKNLYEQSICSISPGYVGLSITQSLSYGRPMIVSEREPHSPELELFSQNANGVYFNTDDVQDLASKLEKMYLERDFWASEGAKISAVIKEHFTYESMVSGYFDVIDRVDKDE